MEVLERVPLGAVTERLRVRWPDGSVGACVLKRPPAREAALYREGLPGAPALLGETDEGLLLDSLEEVHPDFADPATVTLVYRQLAAMHRQYAGRPPVAASLPGSPWLISSAEWQTVLAPYGAPLPMPSGCVTLVHGDCYRWNLLAEGSRVWFLDWEYAAATHPVWDLVMLEPEGPGWEGVPCGDLADLALRVYHEEGPLAGLPWTEFSRLHTGARLFVAARRAAQHRERATAAATAGARAVIEAQALAEHKRALALARQLT